MGQILLFSMIVKLYSKSKVSIAGDLCLLYDFTSSSALPTVPFLEASKSIARGISYAGEGDVLSASLLGALLSAYPNTTFTEMFCPDWKNDTIFLSHMGEMNMNLCDEKPVAQIMNFSYSDIVKPVISTGMLRSGKAVFVNLAPGPDETFSLTLAPVEVLGDKKSENMDGKVRGWIKSEKSSISEFLKRFCMYGGTHHSAIVYDSSLTVLKQFGEFMNWSILEI